MSINLKKWLFKSISRQVSSLLVLLLSVALLLPATYFIHSLQSETQNTTEQLALQLISSLRTSISKPLLFKDNFSAWQLISNQIKNNEQQLAAGSLLKIQEISIIDKDNLVFAHSSPRQHPLQLKYSGITPTTNELALNSNKTLIIRPTDVNKNSLRLYANAIYQGNHSGLIILQMDLTLINQLKQQHIEKIIAYFLITIIIIIIVGYLFGKWISTPLKTIENSINIIGNGKLRIENLKNRHDEYKNLATAIENTDRELYDSHSKIDLLLDSTAEAIYGIDLNGNCTFVNRACINMLNYEHKSELISQNMHQLLHKSTSQNTPQSNANINQKIYLDDEIIWRKDNSSFSAEYWSHPIVKDNTCIGAVVTFIDISKRKKILNNLREREQDLSTMLHSIGDAVIATDASGLITRMNPVAERLTGWKFSDAAGKEVKKVFPIIDASTRDPIINPIDKVISSGEIVYLSDHTTLISKNGKEYHIADSAAPIRDTDNLIKGMILVFNDVTEQYILRAEVVEQKTKLQRIFDDMQSLVVIVELDGSISFINNTPLKLGNLKEHEVFGAKLWDLIFFNYDEQIQKRVKDDCFKAAAGEITFNDIAINTPDGLIWIEISFHPIKDKNGSIIQLVAEGRDINTRKQQEDALRRSQKMDAIGQLAGGIAHDFNNQLGVVIGYLDILQSTLCDDKQLTWLKQSTEATLRCIDLTQQLLTFSRKKSTNKSNTNINTELTNLNTMIARTVTPQIEVEYFLDKNLWLTEINSGDFQDVILNLVINSRDAIPNGGKLTFETSNKTLDVNYAKKHLNLDAGEYVQITIGDTGCGMSKQVLDRIFEPFFTTKEEGTGLGLAMVYSFVHRVGGEIRFYSEIDTGTTIHMYLPRSDSSTINNDEIINTNTLPIGHETILVVDDEKDLLDLACIYLSDLGYQIHKADNAHKALAILESDVSIDLLFSDVVMPGGMNGYELAEQSLQNHPNVKILLTSGFTSRFDIKNKPLKLDNKLLSKPYRKAELAKNIRLTLDEIS